MNYKKSAMVLFLQKSNQTIDSKVIIDILESDISESIKNMVMSFEVKFDDVEDRKHYIEVILNYLVSISKSAKYSILSEEPTQNVNVDVIYENILELVCKCNYYYEETYLHFEKYSISTHEWGGKIKKQFKKIYHPAQRKAYLRGLSSNLERTRDSSFKLIQELKLKLDDDEFFEIAKMFKSKRSEIRINACTLFKDASAETILKCVKYLLEQTKEDLKSGGLSIVVDNLDKVKNECGFEDVYHLVKNSNVSSEYETLKNMILGTEQVKVETLNEIVYDAPKLKYDKGLVKKIVNFDTSKIEAIIVRLFNVFTSHKGEEVEIINYDGSRNIYTIGTNVGCTLYLNKFNNESKIIFQDEFFDVLKEFSYEEARLLQMYFEILTNLVKEENLESERVKYFMKKGYLAKAPKNTTIYKSSNVFQHDNDNDIACYIFKIVIKEYIQCFEKRDESNELKIKFNEIVFNWYAFAIEKFTKKFRMLPSCFYHTALSSRGHTIRTTVLNPKFVVKSPFLDDIIFDKYYASDVLKNLLSLNQYAPSDVPTLKYIELLGYGIDEEFIINKFIDDKFIIYDEHYKNRQVVSLSKILTNWGKREDEYSVDKNVCMRIYNKCVDIMLDAEFKRSDSEAKYSKVLSKCSVFYGTRNFLKAVDKMKKNDFLCIYSWSGSSGIKEICSKIVRNSRCEDDLTQEQFNNLVKEYNISEKKLLEACMYNKNYIKFGSKYLNINGLEKTIYYFIAHGLSDTYGSNIEEIKKNIRRYSDFEIEDFIDGKMDVKWFNEVRCELSTENYKKVYDASKFIMDTTKRKRAQYFADAVTGNLKKSEVLDKINDKRNQDMLLCYGLIPLGNDRDGEVVERYQRLQNFIKESNQFGAQRKVTETKRANIAIANLATTYGMEANSFVWKMEVMIVDKMKEVFLPKKVEDIEVCISLKDPSKPELSIIREGKKIKSVPAKYKKNEYIVYINEMKKEIKNQYARAKVTLEQNMVDSKVFDYSEVTLINKHPIIKEIIKDILFIADEFIGVLEGDKLVDCSSNEKKLNNKSKLRIAHSVDLFENGWVKWQDYIMEKEIKQPFKQVFRELYTLTDDEIKNDGYTNRFAGYQVSGRQALGVLSSRNWIINESDGFEKVNHEHNLRIDLYCYANWFNANALEAETLERVVFLDNKTNKTKNMKELDKILFSETMRDLDLVVSVAYVGGIDPLLNHTTMEMRKRIIEHNLKLFKIENYHFTNNHINIKGQFGDYVIHLGNGIISMQGRGMLPVFPVHSQQRGHIFLPFVDEDPKTSEILTKVLMFAKDYEIKDPTVLMHLR